VRRQAVVERRLGPRHGVTATFIQRNVSEKTVTARGDVLIAADGIHSTVRRMFYPGEGPPAWNGIMIWRGVVEHPPFLTGRSMIIAGGTQAKLVLTRFRTRRALPARTFSIGLPGFSWATARETRLIRKIGTALGSPMISYRISKASCVSTRLIPSRSSVRHRQSMSIQCATVIPSRAGASAA